MARSPLTTLCYIERGDEYLMLHRVKKKNDENQDKWIGVGGHFEEGESPEDCLLREIREETGLSVSEFRFRGLVTFVSDQWPIEYMCLYTASLPEGEDAVLPECIEGELCWVKKEEVPNLNLWEGDKIFLMLLADEHPFFSLKLRYRGDVLTEAVLDGKNLELLDICDEEGNPTGRITARMVAHRYGILHRTAHIWLIRPDRKGSYEVLLQKRAASKDAFAGSYDISSAGHTPAGDEPWDSAVREVREELGLHINKKELVPIGTFYSGDILAEFYGKRFWDREIAHVFILERDLEPEELILQEEEVEMVRWMEYREVTRRIHEDPELYCIQMGGYQKVIDYIENKIRKEE